MFWEIEEIKEKKEKKEVPLINSVKNRNYDLNPNSLEFMGHILLNFLFNEFDYNPKKNIITNEEETLTFKNETEKVILFKNTNRLLPIPYEKIEIHSDYYNLTHSYDWEKMLMCANLFNLNPSILSTFFKCCGIDIIGMIKTYDGMNFYLKEDSNLKFTFYYNEMDFIPYLKTETFKTLKKYLCFGK